MKAAAGFSLLSLMVLAGGQSVAQPRILHTGADETDQEDGDVDQMPPQASRFTEGNIDYDVTYDDSVAQSYDDGYDPEASGQFDQTLAPHGTWIDDDVYGRIWQPAVEEVGDDFSPYATGGRWALTEYGWTWNSDWAWGWAPFHYGRWLALSNRGWCWMPGTLWGPAWVAWRAGGGYVGWVPLAPRNVSVGSPLGARSAWRFAVAADLGRGRTAALPAHMVPGIFGRMTVVSNPRALPIPGARVRVNAGPSFVGAPAAGLSHPTRLAVAAPHALPQRAIEPHPGTPPAVRPWVRASVRLPDAYANGRRGVGSELRPALGRGPAQQRTFPSPSPSSSSYSGLPANRRSPMIHAAPSMGVRVAPGYRGPIYRASPAMAPTPRAWVGPPTRFAPSPSRSSFGNGGSFSGARAFGGGGRSFGGGGGGRSFGGGGGRHR